ncbi:sulfatase [Halosquirtibacter laminarini]|uniref:Sulfatase n=1 Tax=Halosquirtibacter laminarini TaxID=3374600 RepID=A0AC61NM66_9BACT|nr:sulfatase [Prolixibacteraceae bacterium]
MKFKYTPLAILIVLLTLVSCSKKEVEKKRPNILFIMADDHTSQAWGIYGGVLKDYVHNPNIERLADQGMVFDNAMCTNSICVPSRASIMTGEYSNKNQVYMLRDRLDENRPNVAKLLHQNGYQTALIGKWHLKSKPSGFDYFNVLHDQGRYWDPILKSEKNWQEGPKGGEVIKGFSTDVITDLTIDWLKNRDDKKPFMMMCHFKATHEPYDFPERYKDLYKDQEIPYPETLLDFDKKNTGRTYDGQTLENLIWRWEKASEDPEKWWCKYPELPFSTKGLDSIAARKKAYQKLVKDFMRCGAAIDDNIGRLLDYLKEAGLDENTVVIYTADQGYFLGEHGFFDKRMIAEESLHMPFVIRYPKEIKGGTRNEDIILNVDIPALFADYAQVKKPNWMQGESFRPLLKGEHPATWRKSMYYRYWEHYPIRPGHLGVRNDRYKLALYYGVPMDKDSKIKRTAPEWEFYDLKEDPKELHNACQDAQYQDIILEMKHEIVRLRNEVGDDDSERPWIKAVVEKELSNI